MSIGFSNCIFYLLCDLWLLCCSVVLDMLVVLSIGSDPDPSLSENKILIFNFGF